ncbi:MAG: L-2-amino-thiazoline-4-carboxylic acid hydrolase, partial [Firmicutes bacterium]|nr:L-2-amino-thiazoline-4-carboxylic acid hydrolase [Christensenellaceae bacterium]MBR6225257.1 L-2-amino-thiazoline-4-carboxylic acid hydrolase [Bacillota bacterium]
MHEYYAGKAHKYRRSMNGYLRHISSELEEMSGKTYGTIFQEIWNHYEKNMLESFPYIGGDKVSGTGNLTGAYFFVSMGEVLKLYGVPLDRTGHLMVQAYERRFNIIPGFLKKIAHKSFTNVRLLKRKYLKKDARNAANAALNPGSFETKTMIPPEEGYDFSYHNLVCPLSDFARAHGYEEYMPYLCNLDYVMFGAFGVPMFREHTCFEDGDYCDFKLKLDAKPMEYWPPVFE